MDGARLFADAQIMATIEPTPSSSGGVTPLRPNDDLFIQEPPPEIPIVDVPPSVDIPIGAEMPPLPSLAAQQAVSAPVAKPTVDPGAPAPRRPQASGTVREGSRGPLVVEVQSNLRRHDFDLVADGSFGPITRGAVEGAQIRFGLPVTGVVDSATRAALAGPRIADLGIGQVETHRAGVVTAPATLDATGIVKVTATIESGNVAYAALNRNDEGAGVSFGRFQFNQEAGTLGSLLQVMYRADPEQFVALTYGDSPGNKNPQALVETLLRELRDPRQNLTGKLASDLDSDKWKTRFKRLGSVEKFNALQDELVTKLYFEPALEVAHANGLESERALSLLFDLSVQHGTNGAARIVEAAVAANPKQVRQMRDADDQSRPAEEHDVLVLIAQQSVRSTSPKLRSLVRERRLLVLRDETLSDQPSPAAKP